MTDTYLARPGVRRPVGDWDDPTGDVALFDLTLERVGMLSLSDLVENLDPETAATVLSDLGFDGDGLVDVVFER